MSLSHLTALSAQTLSQILELQRFATLPGAPSPPPSLVAQITRNMGSLRTGILDMERDSKGREEVRPMRDQWERMRGMLTTVFEVESLPPVRAPTPPPPVSPPREHSTLDDGIYRPYKDEPTSYDEDEPTHDEMMLQQRHMMDEQDTHLDRLSNSIRNQRDISIQINDELDVHTGLLESLDHELDSTQDRLGRARRRLDDVARGAKDNGSVVAIGVLILVLLILIVVFKT